MEGSTDYDFSLTRINVAQTILLDKRTYSHTCGRGRHNQIVCISLFVSREHCIFFRIKNEVFLMDLKSSNGTFVNGKRQPPKQMIELKVGDVIGIGCAYLVPANETMFIYKLERHKSDNISEDRDQSILSETAITNFNKSLNISDTLKANGSLCKRRSHKGNNDITVPCKMRRLESRSLAPRYETDAVAENVKNKDIRKCSVALEKVSCPINDCVTKQQTESNEKCQRVSISNPDHDVFNVHCTTISSSQGITKQMSNISTETRAPKATNKSENLYAKRSEAKSQDVINRLTVLDSANAQEPTNSGKDERLIRRSPRTRSNISALTKASEATEEQQGSLSISNDKVLDNVNTRRRGKNAQKSIATEQTNVTGSIIGAVRNIPVVKIERLNLEQLPSTSSAQNGFTESATSNTIILHNGYQEIKLEQELQITDDDEEQFNIMVDSPVASPLRLKKVGQGPITRFSEVDVVTLSDDDDNIFPCSQLFDDPAPLATDVKTEVKEENESDAYTGLYEDIITLSDDSDDEDNVWLEKLSRSQIYNNSFDMDSTVTEKIKEPMSIEIDEITDAGVDAKQEHAVKECRKQEEPAPSHKSNAAVQDVLDNEFRIIDDTDGVKIPESEKTIIEKEDAKKSMRIPSKKPVELLNTPRQNLSLNDIEKIDTSKTNKSLSSSRKSLQLIDPPHFYTKKKSGVSLVLELNKSPTAEKSKQEKAKKQRKSKEEREEEIKKKKMDKYFYEKEQKNRKVLHKWANCLPPKGVKRVSLTKEEKMDIIKDRKERLKQISGEGKKSDVEKVPEKRAPPAKAKVSHKTRFDCLVEDTIASTTNGKNDKKGNDVQVSATKTTAEQSEQRLSKADDGNSNSCSVQDTLNKVTKSLQSSLRIDKLKHNEQHKRTHTSSSTRRDVAIVSTPQSEAAEVNNKGIERVASSTWSQKENRSPEERPTSTKPGKKRVSFSDHNKIRVYEIDSENRLTRLVGKDAPIPGEKLRASKLTSNIGKSCQTLDKFLLRIFTWNPVWLEEQQRLQSTPPVVREDELIPMLTFYKSYEDYYRIVLPLLLLEIWHGITKDFDTLERNRNRPTIMCSIVMNSIVEDSQPQSQIRLTSLMLEALITKEEFYKESHPKFGDLVYFEYAVRNGDKCTFHKVFAYVKDVYKTIVTPTTFYNKELASYVKAPYALLTYSMMTRPLENNVIQNRVQRLRTVTYLRANMRMVQAIQYLPLSPLINVILQPKIEAYQLPRPTRPQSSVLVTKDKLNEKQTEAVVRVTEAIVRKHEPKICLIQGPPGTGKSKVIVNIVVQVLYGNDRYRDNVGPMRILVCAPSNAAIDEILIRLLAIRSRFKNRFKMVRIGRPETMHPLARDISVTELAKRDVKRMTANYSSDKTACDSVEEEKVLLQARINALKYELMSSRLTDETYKKHIRMKIDDMNSKYVMLDKRKAITEMNSKELAKIQRSAENRILERADIITCTLSSCYTNQMESIFGGSKERISVCIVDEATQSCEAETLIPLMLGVNTLVLVGDPNQLPATVISQDAKKLGLDQSLFSRVQNAFEGQLNSPIIMLDTQYRMAYAISYWPNRFFYGGKLKNATDYNLAFPFHSYRVLNLDANQNKDKFSNTNEAGFIANIIFTMMHYTDPKYLENPIKIGILTPYNNQRTLVLSKIAERISSIPDAVKKKIITEVNTVDSFQGQERDVIIMSCVRSHGIGFLSDRQRMCVALTRAKYCLILCGNFKTFLRDEMWKELLRDAKSRGVYCNIDAKAEPSEIKKHIIR